MIHEADPVVRAETWKAAEGAEAKLAGECVAFLYEHLCEHEQYTAAAHLLAWALPNSVRADPRIKAAVQHASSLAERMSTSDKELIRYRGHVHEIEDQYLRTTQMITQRGRYWIRATTLFCAGVDSSGTYPLVRAAEYGTGCGSNVLHAAQLAPEIEWTGIDASAEQAAWCADAAKRLGIRAEFYPDPTESLYHKFDSVAVLDVLEHSAHPKAILDRVEKYVRPGGIVTVSMPRGPWSLHTRNGVDAGTHVNVTTIGALADAVERRGRLLDLSLLSGPEQTEANASALAVYQVDA